MLCEQIFFFFEANKTFAWAYQNLLFPSVPPLPHSPFELQSPPTITLPRWSLFPSSTQMALLMNSTCMFRTISDSPVNPYWFSKHPDRLG